MDHMIDLSVPIRIPIDEREIKEEILGKIASEVNKLLYRELPWSREQDAEPLREMVKEQIREIIEENKGIIVDEAVKEVVKRAERRRAARERAEGG